MDGEEVLVRGRCERERVELLRPDGGAGDPYPLPGEDLHVGRAVELDLEDVGGEKISLLRKKGKNKPS